MKALSIQQPWAWLVVNGHKDIENRTWKTRHRGRFAVHASKTFDLKGYHFVQRHFPHIEMPESGEFEKGGIVGFADITDCITERPSLSPWFSGPVGFALENASPCEFKAMPGRLNFFEVQV